jgi:hypothetical protein
VIDLRGQQMVEHVHGGGKQDAVIGLTGAPADNFGQKGFAGAGVADEHHIGALANEVELEQAEELTFDLHSGFMMLEVELVNSVLGVETGEAEAALDSPLVAGFQFQIGQPLEGGREAEILGSRFGQDPIQFAAQGGEPELLEFLVEWVHESSFDESKIKASYSSKDKGSVAS